MIATRRLSVARKQSTEMWVHGDSVIAAAGDRVKPLMRATLCLIVSLTSIGTSAFAFEPTLLAPGPSCDGHAPPSQFGHPSCYDDRQTRCHECDSVGTLGGSLGYKPHGGSKCFFGFGCIDAQCAPPRVWTLCSICRPHQREKVCEWDQLRLRPWFYQPAWKVTGDIYSDFRYFYSPRSFTLLSLGVGLHAVLANTTLDQDFQDSVQRNLGDPDALAIGRHLGNYAIMVPSVVGLWALGECLAQQPACRVQCIGRALNDWGAQTARALFVGAMTTGSLQVLIGASRPNENRGSRWRPFDDDNGVSGHALVGAVPFLVAASRTENRLLCGAFVFASGISAASRVYEDKHYLSQAMLGWWIAYLSVRATLATNYDQYQYRVVPISPSGYIGFAVECRR